MKYCAIVDAYSTGKYLADEFVNYGYHCLHIQSRQEILKYDKADFYPDKFVHNITHRGNVSDTAFEIRSYGEVDFVMAGCESGVELADAISETMALPTNGTLHSRARRDKYLMSERLRHVGVTAVDQIQSNSVDDILAWKERSELSDIVLKPLDSAGSDDVYFCRDAKSIQIAFKAIHGKENAMGAMNDLVLAQKRLIGDQYTVNAVSIDGMHYYSEFWTDKRQVVASGNVVYELEELMDGDHGLRTIFVDYMNNVLDALEIKNGPTHSEFMLTDEGPVLIEVGARLQGGFSPETIVEGLGYNHITLTAKRYADPEGFKYFVKENDPYKVKKYVCAVSLISKEEGLIEAHNKEGLDNIKSLPTFRGIAELLEVGERLQETVDLATAPAVFYLINEDVSLLQNDFQHLRNLPMSELFQLAP